jgi:hypothetical protein
MSTTRSIPATALKSPQHWGDLGGPSPQRENTSSGRKKESESAQTNLIIVKSHSPTIPHPNK